MFEKLDLALFLPLTQGQARSEKTVTEIFFEVLMARAFVGLVKSRRAVIALTRGFIISRLAIGVGGWRVSLLIAGCIEQGEGR